jgi:hypothetical protein
MVIVIWIWLKRGLVENVFKHDDRISRSSRAGVIADSVTASFHEAYFDFETSLVV